jgi:hypothetical protein
VCGLVEARFRAAGERDFAGLAAAA